MIMMGIYTAIIAFSAYLASYLGARTIWRLARSGGFPMTYAQLPVPLAMIGFLTVISMATGVLIAALLVAVMGAVQKPDSPVTARTTLLPLTAAILLATVGVWESPGQWPASVPVIGFLLLAALLFSASLFAARTAELSMPVLSAVTLAALLPLMVAPLVFPEVHGSMALDSAIILAALLGGLMVLPETLASAAFVRLPLSLFVAYGAIQAMHYGAWPLGIVAFMVWLAGVKLAPRVSAERG